MQPLSQRLLQVLYPMLEEDVQAMQVHETEHRKTLELLRQVVSGQIDLKRVKVSDDGWQVLPEEPSE